MKILWTISGGKDSQASGIWAVNESGWKKESIIAVTCDTVWEHEETYKHIEETCKTLDIPLTILKSKKYDGMVDMAKKKGRFPSVKARFCTEELKIKPMIDYILDNPQHYIIVQGIRSDESASRAAMNKQCAYFKYYYEPYDTNDLRLARLNKKKSLTPKELIKKQHVIDRLSIGKQDPKYMTYRKADVFKFTKEFIADIVRPVFDWTAVQVISYILDNGQKPNPLYCKGVERVGCYPCIMCKHKEILNIANNDSEYIKRLEDAEQEVGRTFFGPDYIPKHARLHRDPSSGKRIATTGDVVKYLKGKNETMEMFEDEDDEPRACMSAFNICE